MKNTIRKSVDVLLQENNPDFLDHANMKSLTILTGTFINLTPDIFMSMFNGWQNHRCVKITYMDIQKNITERIFEPHTFVYYENSWYSKGFCHLKQAVRTISLQRIQSAALLHQKFIPDPSIIESVNRDDFLGFEKIENVKIRVSDYIRERLESMPLHSMQTIDNNNIVSIPAISREILLPFLLSWQDKAILLEPEYLRTEVRQKLQETLALYR